LFTGIIEEVGEIAEIVLRGGEGRLKVSCRRVWEDLREGDSVSVDGVCLTAVDVWREGFSADVSSESLQRTTLGGLRRGSKVNLERALAVGGRLGGHIVQGHVDGVGRLQRVETTGEGREYVFSCPQELLLYLVEKGSVAVNGVSLTVSRLGPGEFGVALVPHTLRETNLSDLRPGDAVNLEMDVIGKYVYRYLSRWEGEGAEKDAGEKSLYRKLVEGGYIQ
jgi:riboflavin synthase